MTSPNEKQRVDVLAVMEDAARRIYVNAETQEDNDASDVLLKARAAVAELVEAHAELLGWVDRAVVPGYSPRKPMPENCAKALARSHAALANVGAQK